MKLLRPIILLLALSLTSLTKAQTISVTFSPDTAQFSQWVTATVIVQGATSNLTTIDWYDMDNDDVALTNTNDTIIFKHKYVEILISNRPITITNGNTVLHDTLYVSPQGVCIPCVLNDTPDTALVGQPFIIRYRGSTVMPSMINWADGSPFVTGNMFTNGFYRAGHTYFNTGVYNAWWWADGDTVYTPIVVVDTTQVPLNIITPMGGEVFTANNTDTLTVSTSLFGPIYYYVLGANGDTLAQGDEPVVAVQGNLRKYLLRWPDVYEANARLVVSMAQGTNVGIDTSNVFSIQNRVIQGHVYYDLNSNNVFDNGDFPFYSPHFSIGTGSFNLQTDMQGNYTLTNVPANIDTLILTNVPSIFSVNPTQNIVDMVNPSLSTGNDFVLQPIDTSFHELVIDINRVRSGFPSRVYIRVTNYSAVASVPTTLVYNFDSTQITQYYTIPAVTMNSGSITFNVPSILPMQSELFYINGVITEPVGTTITEGASIPSYDYEINTFISEGGYDPNNIIPSPGIIFTPDNINPEPITYVVNFQNTGNGEAYNIRVNDTIAANLDMNTFEVIESSHAMNTIIRPGGVVDFMFPNIMLPDSNANEPASHGYIVYRIKPTGTLPLNSITPAKVDIYFDYNEAVTTNTGTTTVLEPLGVNEQTAAQFNIFPNPANGLVFIQPNTTYQNDKLTLRIFAADGRMVYTENYNTGNTPHAINTAAFAKGLYSLQISNGKVSSSQKLVIN